jgi:hypothetical protein
MDKLRVIEENKWAVPSTSRMTRAQFHAGLAALAATAALFAVTSRLHHSLTVDEPFMANAVRLPWSVLFGVFRGDNIPFAYVLLKGWTALFGEGEWALRSLSVAAYSAAVVVTGLAGRRAAGSAAGLMAATLMATSTKIGIVHAATARPYALLALVASLALLQSVALLEPTPREGSRRGPIVALALTHLFGLFTHPTYVFVLLAYAAASTLLRRIVVNGANLAAAAALVAYVALWGPVVRATVAAQRTGWWMAPPRFADLKGACLLLWGTGPGMIMLGAVLALALTNTQRTRDAIAATPIRWSLVAAAVAWTVPIAVSFWKPVFLASRTPVMLLPITAVLLGGLLCALAGRLALVTLGGLLLLAGAQVVPAMRDGDPVPTRESVRAVLDRMTCGDTIVAAGLAHAPIEYYLRRLNASSCVHFVWFPADLLDWTGRVREPAALDRARRESRELVEAIAARRGKVWAFGLSRGMLSDASAMLTQELQRALSCDERLPLRGAYFDTVLVCEAPAAAAVRGAAAQQASRH